MRRFNVVSAVILISGVTLVSSCKDTGTPDANGSINALAASEWYTCGLGAGGAAICWGDLYTGEVQPPLEMSGGHHFAQISGGRDHTCALDQGGTAYCWGRNNVGQLGDPSTSLQNTPVTSPVAVAGGYRFARISAGSAETCAIDGSGAAFCWGWNPYGNLGNGSTDPAVADHPLAVTGGHTFSEIAVGEDPYVCALDDTGRAWCWGYNDHGQLGSTGVGASVEPLAVDGTRTFVHLVAGTFHACAADASGAAYCWGGNDYGQLGDGTTTPSSGPVQVSGGHSFVQITSGVLHACGRVADGSVFCWGANDRGQLGNGSKSPSVSPVEVSGGHSFQVIAAGSSHTCGIDTGGSVFCWGANDQGQLGDGSKTDQATPVAVTGLDS